MCNNNLTAAAKRLAICIELPGSGTTTSEIPDDSQFVSDYTLIIERVIGLIARNGGNQLADAARNALYEIANEQ